MKKWIGVLMSNRSSESQKRWAIKKLNKTIKTIKHMGKDFDTVAKNIQFVEQVLTISEKYYELFKDVEEDLNILRIQYNYLKPVVEIRAKIKELMDKYDPLRLLSRVYEMLYDPHKALKPINVTVISFATFPINQDDVGISATKQEITVPRYKFYLLRILSVLSRRMLNVYTDDANDNKFLEEYDLDSDIKAYVYDTLEVKVNVTITITKYSIKDRKVWIDNNREVINKYYNEAKRRIREIEEKYKKLREELISLLYSA